jgi:hypothetical protein
MVLGVSTRWSHPLEASRRDHRVSDDDDRVDLAVEDVGGEVGRIVRHDPLVRHLDSGRGPGARHAADVCDHADHQADGEHEDRSSHGAVVSGSGSEPPERTTPEAVGLSATGPWTRGRPVAKGPGPNAPSSSVAGAAFMGRGPIETIVTLPGTGAARPRVEDRTREKGQTMSHRLRSRVAVAALTSILVLVPAGSALACGGLVAPNGTISLTRTTTLAAYHRGIEHYVTSFEFAGKGTSEVGSIVPLPGVPTKVVKGGDWTLQRLVQETRPQIVTGEALALSSADAAYSRAEVLLETTIDALDITVLKGGAVAVGNWAREHGFFLPPDAPEVLEFYADRSPIFMAARFDAKRAATEGVQRGEGTPIHVVIPTPNPWVPLRILSLGRQPGELVQADVYLLTDREPATLPVAERPERGGEQHGLIQEASAPASRALLADLRSDRGMKWLPDRDMWLTYVRVNEFAENLTHDLAIDASGYGQPDPVAAGLAPRGADPGVRTVVWFVVGTFAVVLGAAAIERRRVLGRVAV